MSLLIFIIDNVSNYRIQAGLHKKKLEMMVKPLDFEVIQKLDRDGNGVDKLEFVLGIFDQLG